MLRLRGVSQHRTDNRLFRSQHSHHHHRSSIPPTERWLWVLRAWKFLRVVQDVLSIPDEHNTTQHGPVLSVGSFHSFGLFFVNRRKKTKHSLSIIHHSHSHTQTTRFQLAFVLVNRRKKDTTISRIDQILILTQHNAPV